MVINSKEKLKCKEFWMCVIVTVCYFGNKDHFWCVPVFFCYALQYPKQQTSSYDVVNILFIRDNLGRSV